MDNHFHMHGDNMIMTLNVQNYGFTLKMIDYHRKKEGETQRKEKMQRRKGGKDTMKPDKRLVRYLHSEV